MQDVQEARREIYEAVTALLGFLALADSKHTSLEGRATFIREAVYLAAQLCALSRGDLLLVVSRDRPELQARLREIFGDRLDVEIRMDRRHAEPESARHDERRRLDITKDLQRIGVGVGRPYLASEAHAEENPVSAV